MTSSLFPTAKLKVDLQLHKQRCTFLLYRYFHAISLSLTLSLFLSLSHSHSIVNWVTVDQLAERKTRNWEVRGSNLDVAIKFFGSNSFHRKLMGLHYWNVVMLVIFVRAYWIFGLHLEPHGASQCREQPSCWVAQPWPFFWTRCELWWRNSLGVCCRVGWVE